MTSTSTVHITKKILAPPQQPVASQAALPAHKKVTDIHPTSAAPASRIWRFFGAYVTHTQESSVLRGLCQPLVVFAFASAVARSPL
jgi:hypothetical protein